MLLFSFFLCACSCEFSKAEKDTCSREHLPLFDVPNSLFEKEAYFLYETSLFHTVKIKAWKKCKKRMQLLRKKNHHLVTQIFPPPY